MVAVDAVRAYRSFGFLALIFVIGLYHFQANRRYVNIFGAFVRVNPVIVGLAYVSYREDAKDGLSGGVL